MEGPEVLTLVSSHHSLPAEYSSTQFVHGLRAGIEYKGGKGEREWGTAILDTDLPVWLL